MFNNSVKFVFLCSLFLVSAVNAAIIENDDLNIIDDAGNASNGLRYLDLSFSDGFTLGQALGNAQTKYANARLATAAEWDDLMSAAGIVYSGADTASDAFGSGGSRQIATGSSQIVALADALGYTSGSETGFWSVPDGSWGGTLDYLSMSASHMTIHQLPLNPAHPNLGWLIVSEGAAAVPEPATMALMGLGLGGLALARRKRKAA